MKSRIELPIIRRELLLIDNLNSTHRLFNIIEDSYGVKIQKFIRVWQNCRIINNA